MMKLAWPLAAILVCSFPVSSAQAFCGFYVSGADASLYNSASVVVLMRDGTRTVVSMQNDYQGPVSDFAMVIPVPEVLSDASVKTLPREIFARVDRLAAPRLVEYWEQDPCAEPRYDDDMGTVDEAVALTAESSERRRPARDLGVAVEAEFAVGEYDILILSARDSVGLETWLHQENYRIPDGAGEVLRPYVEQDMKFFVAKVAADRATFEDGRAVLSPLRFHYDSDEFFLPIRLGLLNSSGEQDILVHILARGARYEVANYDNYAVPTNIQVSDAASANFGMFYDAVVSRMTELYPGSIITEYSWNAGSCDPCPDQPLQPSELVTLGAEVIPSYARHVRGGHVPRSFGNDFVLTRLHARVSIDTAGDDLYFRPAPGITGGNGTPDAEGAMTRGAHANNYGSNGFQGRFVNLHKWEGPVECEDPRRGRWGARDPISPPSAFAAKSEGEVSLAEMFDEDVPELSAEGSGTLPAGEVALPPPPPGPGCGRCTTRLSTSSGAQGSAVLLWALLALAWRRSR